MPMTPNGVANAQSSINNIFSALMKAPLLEQQAEMEAGLKTAQANAMQQRGRLYGAQADKEQYGLERRKSIPTTVEPTADSVQIANYLYGLTGDDNAENMSKALLNAQQFGAKRDMMAGTLKPSVVGPAMAAGEGKPLFNEVGTTGYSMDNFTGNQVLGNRILADAFGQKNASEVAENKAQAYSASQSGNLSKARIGHLGAGGGSQAALQRARANVVNDVFDDLSILPEERESEVERRMALIQLPSTPANSATPAPSAGSMKPLPKGIPAGSVLIGTSGGKPVYQAPNGKRFIED